MPRNPQPYGVSPSREAFIPLPSGNFFVFPNAESSPGGADYVRVVNDKGGEVAYWNSDEWAESPAEVMGAICGSMLTLDNVTDPVYYKFASDCKFPKGVKVRA